MSSLLNKRNTIYGMCAIWIMLFHVYRKVSMPYIPVITNIIGIGNMAVDVFFFFSGLCLSISAGRKDYQNSGWKEYFTRRLKRIGVPYLVICIPYYLWNAAFEAGGSSLHKGLVFISNLSSASFWLRGKETTWFVYGIAAFYILFPVIYSFIIRKDLKRKVMLILGMVIFSIITAYVPILRNSTIVWARLPIFTIGVMLGAVDDKRFRTCGGRMIATAATVLAVAGTITSMSEVSTVFTLPEVVRFLMYCPMTLALMQILSIKGDKNRALEWAGGLSLELYLVHITLLHPMKYYGLTDRAGYLMYIILPLVSIVTAVIADKIEKMVYRLI